MRAQWHASDGVVRGTGWGRAYHAAGVAEGVLLANPVGDKLLVLRVVEGGTEVTGGKHLALACSPIQQA